MKYGELPKVIKQLDIHSDEMFFYQYLLIKLSGEYSPVVEPRLNFAAPLIGTVCCDYIAEYGLNAFMDCYVYITAKRLFQKEECPFNRPGYHSDGFMTNDINYIWYDSSPTVFNSSDFSISQDDSLSLSEMEQQALPVNEVTYPINTILRLNQYCIHKTAEYVKPGIRTFIKISISPDKYDLKGNSINPLLNYNWEMRERQVERNIPQKL
jgi:hypothetical protein